MNQKQYLKRFKEITETMYIITQAKNADYSGNEAKNAFKNFDTIDFLTDWKIQSEHGLLVRITDKMTRIANLMFQDNNVKDEKIEDTLQDMANYCIILLIYLENKDGKKK